MGEGPAEEPAEGRGWGAAGLGARGRRAWRLRRRRRAGLAATCLGALALTPSALESLPPLGAPRAALELMPALRAALLGAIRFCRLLELDGSDRRRGVGPQQGRHRAEGQAPETSADGHQRSHAPARGGSPLLKSTLISTCPKRGHARVQGCAPAVRGK